MKAAPIPANEAERIAALRSYEVLDSEPDPEFDALVKIAAHITGMPMALVTLIDTDRQWFKATHGIGGTETKREEAFCAHAVAANAPLIVEDAHADERFFDNPFVTGDPHVRFYAGMPLRTPDGHVLGTLCTLDDKPGHLSAEQLQMLQLLANQAVALLEARRRNIALAQRTTELLTFRATLDRTQDAILVFDPGTLALTWVNEGAVLQLAYPRSELLAMTPLDLVPEEHHAAYRKALDAAAEPHAPVVTFESVHRDRLGRDTPVEVVLQYLGDVGGAEGRWISVVREIAERKRIEKLQSEFVSTVSHELRTPLTSIRGSLGLVAGGITGALPAEAKEYVDIALHNSDRLIRLVNDILDIEKMQSGRMEFRFQSLPLPALLRTVTSTPIGTPIVMTTVVPEVEVVVDADRFAQVMTNLLGNAGKFSPTGAAIEIAVTLVAERVRIEVRDRGPGVPAEFRTRLFERFAQADPSTTRARGGTGLGLSITKAIVDRMRGTIGHAPNPGGGAIFFFELPALPAASTASGQRVLVCEDEPEVYAQITKALGSGGFVTDVAPTIERARRLLAARHYDAVTLDLMLADGDSTDLVAEISGTTPPTPVVVVSGSNRDLGRAAVLVTDVIAKPFHEARLLDAVRRVVSGCAGDAPRVLHVEDDEDVRRIVARTFPPEWAVTGAESVHRARQLLATQTFDAVVIDLGLPDGSGADLIPLAGAARVVIFTARDVDRVLSARVSAALTKTRSTAADLGAVVRSLVEARR